MVEISTEKHKLLHRKQELLKMIKTVIHTKDHRFPIEMDEIAVKYFKNSDKNFNHMRREEDMLKEEIHRMSNRLYMIRK